MNKEKPKKGQKGPRKPRRTQVLKDQQIAEKFLQSHNYSKVAKELGVDRKTVVRAAARVLSDDQIREAVQRSRDRNVKMLGLCDGRVLDILKDKDPIQTGNQVRVINSIYKTFGVWKDEALVQINHITPIQVKVEGETFTLNVGTAQETGSSIQEREQDYSLHEWDSGGQDDSGQPLVPSPSKQV